MHISENPFVAAQLRSLVYYSLDNELLSTGLFHAGRLHGLDSRNGDSAHLISLCHFRLGQYKAAYDYSRDKGLRGQHLGCAYIFAQSCLSLQRYTEGIAALERSKGQWHARNHWNKHSESSRRHIPDAAAVTFLLGKLWVSYGETNKAVELFVEALRLNPFLWDAFVELCNTGAKVKATNVFKLTSEMLASLDAPSSSGGSADSAHNLPLQPHINGNLNGMVTPGHDPFNTKSSRPNSGIYNETLSNSATDVNGVDWETPTANGSHGDEDIMMDESQFETEAPHAPARRTRGLYPFQPDSGPDIPRMRSITTRSRTKAGSETSDVSEVSTRPTSIPVSYKRSISGQVTASSSSANLEPPGAPARRSDRLLRNRILPSGSRLAAAVSRDPESKEKRELRRAKATGAKGKSTSTVGRVVSGNRKPPEYGERDGKERLPSIASTTGSIREARKPAPPALELSPNKDALLFLLEQYSKIGYGYLALSKYDCQVALGFFDLVVPAFRETPWVLAQIGRAHFEKSSYAEAEQVFAKIRKIAPSRTEDMEIYSTVLWHLKKDVDLAYISHELIETDRLSPQAWCALGNAFSLQGEHDQAVKCFKRATQLDPKFAYAFTLSGHEHVANEEFEKALDSFRHAISADHRHYNGWYGLGQVFEKLGKYDIAKEHYTNASKINPTNPVLKVCIGLVLEKTKRREMALVQYEEACELDPRSAKARFAKARMLLVLQRPKEAFLELDMLKNIVPDDAKVHYLLGRVYKALHEKSAALRHFTIAMNLDPKATNLIKESLEALEDSDDDLDADDMD